MVTFHLTKRTVFWYQRLYYLFSASERDCAAIVNSFRAYYKYQILETYIENIVIGLKHEARFGAIGAYPALHNNIHSFDALFSKMSDDDMFLKIMLKFTREIAEITFKCRFFAAFVLLVIT